MKIRPSLLLSALLALLCPFLVSQQLDVPQVFRYTAILPVELRDSSPRPISIVARIYSNDVEGVPLWVENFEVTPDQNWRISILLGSTRGGLPASTFAENSARWIGLQVDDAPELPRAALISVPYALKSRDADTLGGLPPSAFLTSTIARASTTISDNNARTTTTGSTTYVDSQPAAINMIPKFISAVELGSSQIADNGYGIGIGTLDPQEMLDINGRAILRNTSRGPSALFFANNDSSSPMIGTRSTDPSASLGFFHGGAWRMNITPAGRVGIGVDTPAAALDVNGGIKLSSGTLVFPDGSSMTSATGATATVGSGDSSITVAKSASTTTIAVADSGITSAKLADNSVTASKIPDGSISASKLAPGLLLGGGSASLGTNLFTGQQSVVVNTPPTPAINAVNTSTSDSAIALYAETASTSGIAIKAYASSTSGHTAGVFSITDTVGGYGVYSQATATTGYGIGSYGISRSNLGIGVQGETTSSSGTNYGVYGTTPAANYSAGVYGIAASSTANSMHYGVYGKAQGIYGVGVLGFASNTAMAGSPVGVGGVVASPNGVAGQFVNTASSGDILQAKNTAGNVWRVDVSGNQFMAGTVRTGGADFAELVETSPSSRACEAGDVLAIAANNDRRVELTSEAYSTRVLGVYATKPGILASHHSANDTSLNEVPVAMLGIVPVKASAENGAIRRGDLLVTSSIPGHVMRATDRSRFAGAIVGKAMQSLESGTGLIEIAVTLQ